MADRLKDKRLLVTAAAQGIGRATALAAAAEGALVTATDINAEALAALAATCPALETRVLDVLDPEAVRGFADTPFDSVVHCAGVVHGGTLISCAEEDWRFAWRLNVDAAFQLARAVSPGMIERGGGSIVLIGSVASSLIGVANRFAYGVTKAALIGMAKSIAVDFARDQLRCNVICPGTVETPSLQQRINAFPDPEQARADFIARQPMGRLGRAEEIAAAAIHLASDEAAYTTGQCFVVDGGWTAA